MPNVLDRQLLEQYVHSKDQQAFAELVRRHVDLVHGAARRQAPQAADDITQAVFLLLAQKAARLPRNRPLAGWLCQATRFCCANLNKSEALRHHHEQEAAAMAPASAPDNTLQNLLPLLDESLAKLSGSERDAVVLRYLEGKSFEETGAELSITADAAGKRAGRGLEKLRAFFAKRGYIVPAAVVAGLLTAESAHAAPAALAVKVVVLGAHGAVVSAKTAAIAKGALNMMAWIKVKLAALYITAALVLGGGAVSGYVAAFGAPPGSPTAVPAAQPAAPPPTEPGTGGQTVSAPGPTTRPGPMRMPPRTPPVATDGPTVSLEGTIYELRLPPDQISRIDIPALTAAATTPAAFEKALAQLGQAKPLYRANQSVRLAGDHILIGATVPIVTGSRTTDDGRVVSTVMYQQSGAMINIAGQVAAGGRLDVNLDIELSVLTDNPADAATDAPTPQMRRVTMAQKGLTDPGKPVVTLSADATFLDSTGKAVAYVTRFTLSQPSAATKPSATQSAKELILDLGNGVSLKLVLISAGQFTMGSPVTENGHSLGEMVNGHSFGEEVQHEVTISKPFYMGATHVTVDQFAAFVKDSGYKTDAEKDGWSGGSVIKDGKLDFQKTDGRSWRNPSFEQKGDHPVVQVSWNDAQAFCDWLSKKTGQTVVLPTEAQWEYACRAGTTTAYPWGDDPADGKGWVNGADQSLQKKWPNAPPGMKFFSWDDGFLFTSPVGTFKANAFGLYDMIGHAWQWCQDIYGDYGQDAATDPAGADTGEFRILRGGSWINPPLCRSACRNRSSPKPRTDYVGFRVVVAAGVE
jgi:formylglycine-generating enzyme